MGLNPIHSRGIVIWESNLPCERIVETAKKFLLLSHFLCPARVESRERERAR